MATRLNRRRCSLFLGLVLLTDLEIWTREVDIAAHDSSSGWVNQTPMVTVCRYFSTHTLVLAFLSSIHTQCKIVRGYKIELEGKITCPVSNQQKLPSLILKFC